ncbi:MAG: glycosyl transferase family 1 [Porticoccaceae bacterium]|nr:glycosyl transferase family 1 [Porticoccaceae bacterium]
MVDSPPLTGTSRPWIAATPRMNRLRGLLRALLRAAATIILKHPSLRQAAFRLLTALPGPIQSRLRRVASPTPNHFSTNSPVHRGDPRLSRRENRLLDALKAAGKSPATRADSERDRFKPRLAYISPLPPVRSGISDYSAELLPELSEFYDIELIIDQDTEPDDDLAKAYPVRSTDWFQTHARDFDRIVYQFGNSLFHAHMFDLLEEHPGIVVLHDFFLSHVVANIDAANYGKGVLNECLYRSHGYRALQLRATEGIQKAIWNYPCNFDVLEQAVGVISHSDYNLSLTTRFYGPQDYSDWQVIPLLRQPAIEPDRLAARRHLGLPDEAFVVCTFGHLTTNKLNDRLLNAWLNSEMADRQDCYLIFVGESPLQGSGPVLEARIRDLNLGERIYITGWLPGNDFRRYLSAADVGVQLRSNSRGETSAAALDCMNYGLATIVNANGSMSAMPRDAVVMLDDEFADRELTAALESLQRQPEMRHALAQKARNWVHRYHTPEQCARRYRDFIEGVYGRKVRPTQQALRSALGACDRMASDDDTLVGLARELADTVRPSVRQRQLLVDISAIARHDLKTGIERVARAQLIALLNSPPEHYRVEPVYLSEEDGRWHYRYARQYVSNLLKFSDFPVPDEVVDVDDGDHLYAPDFFPRGFTAAGGDGLFSTLKGRGVRISVLVHDVLPITAPKFFPPDADQLHKDWLQAASRFADTLICISSAVADDVRAILRPTGTPPRIEVIHHGADIESSSPSRGLPGNARKLLKSLSAAPTFLMVGTVEPRKGHLQAIAAFDLLWQKNLNVNLVVVGKEGWTGLDDRLRRTIPQITSRLNKHPERNRRLFWLEGISDEYLEAIYNASTCLLAASEGEGFGLPLIEAAQKKLPIIARDIPVFREVAGDHANYFDGAQPEQLADAIERWLIKKSKGEHADSGKIQWLTWQQNVENLKSTLLGS